MGTQNATDIDILYRVKHLLQSGNFSGALSLAKSAIPALPAAEAEVMRELIAAISIVLGDASDAPMLDEVTNSARVLELRALAAIRRGDLDAAASACSQTLKISPDSISTRRIIKMGKNFANAAGSNAFSSFVDNPEDRQRAIRDAIKAMPALELLRAGKFKEGFTQILKQSESDPDYFFFFDRSVQAWKGNPVCHLLVVSYGGIGDILQYARYINAARERCDRLTVAVPAKMVSLFSNNFKCIDVVSIEFMAPALQTADAAMQLDLLPPLLQMFNYGNTPYLTADPLFHHKKGRKQVGLCWKSSANGELAGRTASINDFSPLAELEGIDWHSLVPRAGADWMQIYHPTDYEATARLVSSLDLIITVDTGVAHLSGAMGKPTWILLPVKPCWRWGTHPTKSAWYPTATLYRRQPDQPWISLVRKAAADLRSRVLPGLPPCGC